MTDTDLLKNTRNTRNTTGMGWGFSLCTADEGDSDSELEDASAGSHNSPAPSPDRPISEELRLVRDLDLGTRQDTAVFKSNPWTIAKLRAATRKPTSITPSTGLSVLPSLLPQALASTPTSKAQSILDPHLKDRVQPQPTLRGKNLSSQKEKLSPPRKQPNLSAMGPNPDHIPGTPSISLGPPAIHKLGKSAGAILAQPRPSPVENCTSREQERIQLSRLGTHSKGPPFPSRGETILENSPHQLALDSVSPVTILGHIDPSFSPVKQSSLHSTVRIVVSPNRSGFLNRLSDPLAFLPRSSTSDSSPGCPTASPVKPRFPATLLANRAGIKRKRPPSPSPYPLRPTRSVNNRTPNSLLTVGPPAEPIIPPKTPVHQERPSAYDSRIFTFADEKWSTLSQNKSRISFSKTPTTMTQNSFRIPSLKLPGIGNQASRKSWLLTTFQPPPPLEVPNLSTSEGTENLKEEDDRIPFLESMNHSSSQTVVENENFDDEQVSLDKYNNKPPLLSSSCTLFGSTR